MGSRGRVRVGLYFFVAIVGMAATSGCGQKKKASASSPNPSCSSRVSSVYMGASERTYCNTPQTHTASVTISGSAAFETRPYTMSSGLGAISGGNAIRYAEVVAYGPTGQIVQCTETTSTGTYTMELPTSADTYTVSVYSRGDNAQVRASVLNCPEENVPYSVSASVIPDAPKTVNLNATAASTGALTGAAFNIFDQIVQANDFMRAQVGTCSFTGCPNFTVAPKVQAYWAKGFNPNEYFSAPLSGLSFYLPGYSRLFILGGIGGDIYNSDTDHFDNSVILHEYGHFLEDVYTVTDSPGGSHSANSMIDPRLAWSEGWGNFIQAAIRNEGHYRDTEGTTNASNPISSSVYIFNIATESPDASCATLPSQSGCDIPTAAHEGNFREFSVTRMLWDVFDGLNATDAYDATNTYNDNINNQFAEVWAVLTTGLASGFLDPNAEFRNSGLLNDFQLALTGRSDWTALRTAHKEGGSIEYARYVTRTAGCLIADNNAYPMTPYQDPSDYGYFSTSNLLKNNDFLFYHHAGGTFSLSVNVATNAGGVYEPDVDLYLYNSRARYGNASDMVTKAEHYWDNNPATNQTESIVLNNLSAGNYLINVKLFTGAYQIDNNSATNNCIGSGVARVCENDPSPYIPAGDPITYELVLNGVSLCPTQLP